MCQASTTTYLSGTCRNSCLTAKLHHSAWFVRHIYIDLARQEVLDRIEKIHWSLKRSVTPLTTIKKVLVDLFQLGTVVEDKGSKLVVLHKLLVETVPPPCQLRV